MKQISYNEFLDFLTSDLSETQYFGCDKTSLISLKDYLFELKQRMETYERLISEPLKSIQSKNKWVINVVPRYDGALDGVIIYGKNDPALGVGINPIYAQLDGKNPNDYVLTGGMLITPFHNLKLKNRIKVLDNSQDEIREIDLIARNLNFVNEKFDTASGIFTVESSEYNKCHIACHIDYFDWCCIRFIISTGQLREPSICSEENYEDKEIYLKKLLLEEGKKLVKKLSIKY